MIGKSSLEARGTFAGLAGSYGSVWSPIRLEKPPKSQKCKVSFSEWSTKESTPVDGSETEGFVCLAPHAEIFGGHRTPFQRIFKFSSRNVSKRSLFS